MLPSERALADLMVRDLDARLALTHENESLRNGSTAQDDNRIDDLNRRLQAETAEKDRLRRELERAEAKLEAIATLEGGAQPPRP
jgi:predicted  nucleic acid-binding Zn-ribbon protein